MENAVKVAIKVRLNREGRSFAWLARRMKLSKPTVANQLNAEKGPTVDFLKRACKALGIGYKRLIAEAEAEYELATATGRKMREPTVNGPHRP